MKKKVAKGTRRVVKDRHLRHANYLEAVQLHKQIYVKQNNILSREHSVGTYHQTRVSFTAFDTKRWICSDGIHTLAYGHHRTLV